MDLAVGAIHLLVCKESFLVNTAYGQVDLCIDHVTSSACLCHSLAHLGHARVLPWLCIKAVQSMSDHTKV